jgi:hypothetical protein
VGSVPSLSKVTENGPTVFTPGFILDIVQVVLTLFISLLKVSLEEATCKFHAPAVKALLVLVSTSVK